MTDRDRIPPSQDSPIAPPLQPGDRPTNFLAAELRGILDDLHDAEHGAVPKPLVRERLQRLTEHVEQLGAESAEHELEAIRAGLEPEQKIRDRGLERAVRLLAPVARDIPEVLSQLWSVADECAAYIRHGERPA